MSFDVAISLDAVAKTYRFYSRPMNRLLEALPWAKARHEAFEALKPLSLDVKRGEVFGIVGRNGAGKSTLLQLICGTLPPSAGKITVNGRIAALLELGAGFNPEFTGRENIWMNAGILGMTHDEIEARFDEIVAFSEIEYAIDHPVKTYSSGMFVRLAFSVAVHVSPDILVIDEALSVGDGAFAKKSFDRIMALKNAGCTILFCSHSMYQVQAICDRALWLDQGDVRALGDVSYVLGHYEDALKQPTTHPGAGDDSANLTRPGDSPQTEVSGDFRLVSASFSDSDERRCDVRTGDKVSVKIVFDAPADAVPAVGITLLDAAENTLCSASTVISQRDVSDLQPNAQGYFLLELLVAPLPLLKGQYTISTFLLSNDGALVLDTHPHALQLFVTQSSQEVGVFSLGNGVTWNMNP